MLACLHPILLKCTGACPSWLLWASSWVQTFKGEMGCMNAKYDSEEISDLWCWFRMGVSLLQENVVWWEVWPPH